MKKLYLLSFIIFYFLPISAQVDVASKYAATITEEDLKDYLTILSSDALEGRETGTRGLKMAAAFIENHFEVNGLLPVVENSAPSYLQKVPLISTKPGETYVIVEGEKKMNFEDIVYFGTNQTDGEISMPVVFGGTGSEAELSALDFKNKAVLVYTKGGIESYKKIESSAQEKGALAVLVVNTDDVEQFKGLAGQFKNYIGSSRIELAGKEKSPDIGLFFTSPDIASSIFNKKSDKIRDAINSYQEGNKTAYKNLKDGEITIKTSQDITNFYSSNVLGYLEGTDKKEELIVVTAHYDHIGKSRDQINNGADDDGSGTSAVMEIAQAFALAKEDGFGPRRSLLFMTVTAEEKGLLGSSYYVNNPVIDLNKTVANLNIDMIGRVDEEHADDSNYVYLVGSNKLSQELHDISEQVNEKYTQLTLDYTYNDENHPDRIYYRSDHWNFAKNNIPVIFYFNGTHEDYHRPTDTIEKIEFEPFLARTRLVFYTAWQLANNADRITLNQQ